MNLESLYKAFKKFSKGVIKKDGFNLYPKNVDRNNRGVITFYFDFEPLGDISYQKSGLEEVVWDEVVMFFNVIGEFNYKWEKLNVVVDTGEYPNLNISKKFEKKIDDIMDSIKVVEICDQSCVKIEVEHINTNISFQEARSSLGGESIFFENFVRPIKGYLKIKGKGKFLDIDLDEAVKYYEGIQEDNRFEDSNTNYLLIDEAVSQENGFNDTNQVIYVLTRFVDESNY